MSPKLSVSQSAQDAVCSVFGTNPNPRAMANAKPKIDVIAILFMFLVSSLLSNFRFPISDLVLGLRFLTFGY
jgi:hypothetical protein